jgi:hypothetical protein
MPTFSTSRNNPDLHDLHATADAIETTARRAESAIRSAQVQESNHIL